MKRNDTLWKGILESLFPDFLKYFFKDADVLFDMEKGFQFLDKELEQLFPAEEIKAPRFVDKLVKVFTKSGREEWILVHIEVQGYHDKNFSERMFTYFYRILDKYEKRVTSIAVYTDANKNFHPKMFTYEYLGTRITFQFNTFKVIDQDEKSLAENDNPFAIVILTVLLALKRKNLDDEDLYNLKYAIAKNLLERKIHKNKVDELLVFLQRYVTFENSGYNVKFDNVIEELTEKQKTMGVRELVLDLAEKEGIEKGKTEAIKNLLAANRFTDAEIANFAGVTEKFVLNVKKAIK